MRPIPAFQSLDLINCHKVSGILSALLDNPFADRVIHKHRLLHHVSDHTEVHLEGMHLAVPLLFVLYVILCCRCVGDSGVIDLPVAGYMPVA